MAFDRAAPPALRWVAAFLALCAALGLWLGFKDQMRRNPPAWYTGAAEPVATSLPGGAAARDAVAFDPNAPARPVAGDQPSATTQQKAEAKPEDKTETMTPAEAFVADTKPLEVPAAPKPKATPTPATKPAPSEDPVGDILDGQKPVDAPPPVPY